MDDLTRELQLLERDYLCFVRDRGLSPGHPDAQRWLLWNRGTVILVGAYRRGDTGWMSDELLVALSVFLSPDSSAKSRS